MQQIYAFFSWRGQAAVPARNPVRALRFIFPCTRGAGKDTAAVPRVIRSAQLFLSPSELCIFRAVLHTMKSFFLFFLLFPALATVLPAQSFSGPRGIQTEIIIKAPPARVWEKLSNFGEYASWHTYLTGVDGTIKKGRMLTFYLRKPGNRKKNYFKAKLLTMDVNRELAWGGSFMPFIRARHYFILQPIDAEHTRLVQGEYWKGWFGKSMGKKIYEETFFNFNEMNEKLREMLEGKEH